MQTLADDSAVQMEEDNKDHATEQTTASSSTEQSEGINSDDTIVELSIPKCEIPCNDPAYETVAQVVAAAVEEQDLHSVSNGRGPPMVDAYRGLVDTLRSKQDAEMMRYILLALRTSGQGKTLTYLTQSSEKHTPLVHLIVRLNPYELNNNDNQGVKADYAMADAQLHLLMALVSSNSVFLVPTMTALWKCLSNNKGEQDAPEEKYVSLFGSSLEHAFFSA